MTGTTEPAGATGPGRVFLMALVAITLIGPVSVHFFLPALADIRHDLRVPIGVAQLSFSMALLAMAAATLIFGSLADRYGRRPVLLGGLALFTSGAVLATVAPGIEVLIAGRVVQGTGAACGVVVARAIVRDVYGVDRLGQAIAYLTAAYAMAPMIAPPIGGVLVDGFGWRAIAAIAAITGVLVFVLSAWVLTETRPPRARGALDALRPLAGYRRLLGEARFTLFAFQPGFATAAFFTHASAAAFLMDEVLNRPASDYGLLFLFGPAGFVLGNFLSARIGLRVGRPRMVVWGSGLSLGAVGLLISLLWLVGMTPMILFLPTFFLTMGQGIAMPHAQAAAIATDARFAGTASGIVVFLQFGLAAVLSILVGHLADGTVIPMIAIMLIASCLSFACGATAVRMEKNRMPRAVDPG